jgi:hypothetical protein
VHETHKRKVINTIHSLLPAEELPSVTWVWAMGFILGNIKKMQVSSM